MAYVPNATDVTQPTEDKLAQTAAAEFRALKAYVQTIVSGGGLGVATPGQIAMFAGTTPLPGWLELDGTLKLRSTYPALWAAAIALSGVTTEADWATSGWGLFSDGDGSTTFRIPDYRGEFIRAWDHGRGVDPGRLVGRREDGTNLQKYMHSDSATPGSLLAVSQLFTNADSISTDATSPNSPYYMNAATVNLGGAAYTGTFTTRPRNLSSMYCIKT